MMEPEEILSVSADWALNISAGFFLLAIVDLAFSLDFLKFISCFIGSGTAAIATLFLILWGDSIRKKKVDQAELEKLKKQADLAELSGKTK